MKKDHSQKIDSQQLKQYFLEHKDNQEAFHAYVDSKIKGEKEILFDADELDSLPQNLQVELVAQRLKEKFNL